MRARHVVGKTIWMHGAVIFAGREACFVPLVRLSVFVDMESGKVDLLERLCMLLDCVRAMDMVRLGWIR